MNFYTHMQFLGDYCDVDIEYEIIEGDDSVGLADDYEFTATYINEYGLTVDITDDLTREEVWEVIEAIKKDLEEEEYNNATD
jgi:uncharacterized metal-binding protein